MHSDSGPFRFDDPRFLERLCPLIEDLAGRHTRNGRNPFFREKPDFSDREIGLQMIAKCVLAQIDLTQ